MSYKIAIVEDESAVSKMICDYIERYSRENGEYFEVTSFADGDEIASDYKPVYNIIFLDILMKRLDGMSAAEYIRELDKDVILVFITNMTQYAIKGYKVDALDYLLKPVSYFAFAQQLKRCLERLKKTEASYLLLPTEKGVVKMDAALILYIESYGHHLLVHTKEQSYKISGTMKELEAKLSYRSFFRCNNGYLVNLSHVRGVSGNIVTLGKHSLLISRPRRKAFMSALAEFAGNITGGAGKTC